MESSPHFHLSVALHNSKTAEIRWIIPDEIDFALSQLTLRNTTTNEEYSAFLQYPQSHYVPPELRPGNLYEVRVKLLAHEDVNKVLRGGLVPVLGRSELKSFRAVLQKRELQTLLDKAMTYIKDEMPDSLNACRYLYRNKPLKYFKDIEEQHGSMMEVYIKDNSGDQASPINGRIKGLFFLANVDNLTKLPLATSPFGERRLLIKTDVIFQETSWMYFADFYCMSNKGTHYVTLVLTKPGSEADLFCEQNLIPLDVHDNPFLLMGNSTYKVSSQIWVEVLYTENIDIRSVLEKEEGKFDTVPSKGTSTPGGKSKDTACPVCNLNIH